ATALPPETGPPFPWSSPRVERKSRSGALASRRKQKADEGLPVGFLLDQIFGALRCGARYLFEECADRGDRRLTLVTVRPTGLRHIGTPAAALAAKRFRARPHQIDGADLVREIVGYADHDRGFPLIAADQHDHAAFKLLLDLVGHGLQVFRRHIRKQSRDKRNIADFLRRLRYCAAAAAHQLFPCLGQFALKPLALFDQATDALPQVLRRGL